MPWRGSQRILRAPVGPLILCSQTLGPGQPWFRAFSERVLTGISGTGPGANDTSVDGYTFYDSSMLGDVVKVRNSGEKTVDPANGLNGLNGWNLSWAEWRAGSAVGSWGSS